jgi:WD40 repeat protein
VAALSAGKEIPTGVISVQVATLVEQGLKTLFTPKQIATGLVSALGFIACGVGLILAQSFDGRTPENSGTHQAETPAERAGQSAVAEARGPHLDLYGDPLPVGAVARLGSVRFRSWDPVDHVALSPGGKLLAVAGRFGGGPEGIQLWEVATGKPGQALGEHVVANSVAFSPDGRLLAAGSGNGYVLVWELDTGQRLHQISLTSNQVPQIPALVFSPDSKVLFSGDGFGLIRLWDMKTGDELARMKADPRVVRFLAILPSGKTLISAGDLHPVRFWDVATRKEVRRIDDQQRAFLPVALSTDRRMLASRNMQGEVDLWDLETGKWLRWLTVPKMEVSSIVCSPDGRSLVTAGRRFRVWDLATGKQRLEWPGPHQPATSVVFSPDGKAVASTHHSGKVWWWDVSTGRELFPDEGHVSWVHSLAFSRDGRLLASGKRRWHCAALGQGYPQAQATLAGRPGACVDGRLFA